MLDRRVDPIETSGIMEPRFHPPGDKTARAVSTGTATATIAAGVGNEKWVVTGFSFNLAPTINILTVTTVGCYVIDGTSGATTYLWQEIMGVGSLGSQRISMTHLNLVGSANTALTIEFSGGVTSAMESVNISYHAIGGQGA